MKKLLKTLVETTRKLERTKKLLTSAKFKKWLLVVVCVIVVAAAGYSIYRSRFYKKDAVAIINGQKITIAQLKKKISKYPDFYQQYMKQYPQEALNDYIGELLLLQQAKKYAKKYREKINEQIEDYKKDLLIREYLNDQVMSKAEITEDEIKAYYNEHLKEFFMPERVHLYEIVVPTQEAAETILKRLNTGEDFSEIARKESISTSSKDKGGDIGIISRGQLMPEMEELIFSMKTGEVFPKVIKTEQGYHIVKVGEKMPAQLQTLEQASPTIRQNLIQMRKKQLLQTYVNQLKNQSKIQQFPENLKAL